jgi:ubiquinone/menaquinone biosynthesis C-methylase UbiE
VPDAIRRHYDLGAEVDRLSRGPGKLERERTKIVLARHLPPPPATVIDVGGAIGAYAFDLADAGYVVHLVDLVESHVERARKASSERAGKKLAGAWHADARELPFDDATADVVLVLGPLYHLVRRDERVAALREARRVLRPGGLLVAAAISRFASSIDGLVRKLLDDPAFVSIVEKDLATGVHENPTGRADYFTTAYFHRPEELALEIEAAGLGHVETLAVEGPAWMLQDFDAQWSDPARRERILALLARIEKEPALIGASAHFLSVGRRER